MKQQNSQSQLQLTKCASTNSLYFSNILNKDEPKKYLKRYLNMDIKCLKGNKISFLCHNKNCISAGIMCNDEECACYKQHIEKGCFITKYKSSINFLQKRILKFQSFQQIIDSNIQKAINQLSEIRQKILLKFSQQSQFIGLQQNHKNFLNILQKKQFNKITGKLTFELIFDQKLNQKIKIITKKIQDYFKQQFNTLQKNIKEFQQKLQKIYIKTINNKVSWDTKIIKSNQQIQKIQGFFIKNIKQVKLLFRASQYAFQSAKFHQKCDGKTNTICLIQTEFGKIIGGYTPLPWHSNGAYSVDDKFQSFIFSLTNNHKFKLTKKQNTIYGRSDFGPFFGGGSDIRIYDKSNQNNSNNSSYANICHSYNHQEYKSGDKSSWQKYSGGKQNYNFKTKQYQVFEIIFA